MTESNDYGEIKGGKGGKIHPMPNTAEFHRKASEYGFTQEKAVEMYNSLDSYEVVNSNHSAEGMLGTVNIDSLLEEVTDRTKNLEIEEAVREAYDNAETRTPGLDKAREGKEVTTDDLI